MTLHDIKSFLPQLTLEEREELFDFLGNQLEEEEMAALTTTAEDEEASRQLQRLMFAGAGMGSVSSSKKKAGKMI
jgi:hypothetical protein